MRYTRPAIVTISALNATGIDADLAMGANDVAAAVLTASTGDVVIGTAGRGIDFSADAHAAGMTAELLNDYEEGTWTFDLQFGGAKVGLTYNAGFTTGYYTKIGDIVICTGYCILTSNGTSVGAARLYGLPFVAAATSGGYASVSLRLAGVTFANQFMGQVPVSDTYVRLLELTEGGVATDLSDADFSDSAEIILTAIYRVA